MLQMLLDMPVMKGRKYDKIDPDYSKDAADVKGFDDFLVRYNKGLAIERAAVESI